MRLAKNQLLVVSTLAQLDQEVAGIEIADALPGLARSSVYAALAALQRDGFLSARWNTEGSHPKRLVRINGAGLKALAKQARGVATQKRLVPEPS